MMKKKSRRRNEAGETLAELLVTIAILGVAIVLLVGALADSILASSLHRQLATGDTIARSVSEVIKGTPFNASGSYPATLWTAPSDPANLVTTTGFSVTPTVKCLNGATFDTATYTSSCPSPYGLQQITVTVTSNAKGQTNTVTILKRST
jgi:type II secretory pathway pseudopilin PulG